MIMKANKQIGFIYKNNESIDKILKDGDVVFERGFLREKTSTTLPITFGGVGKDLKDYKIYGNTYQNSTSGKNLCGVPNLNTTVSGVEINIIDGIITLNGTATGAIFFYINPINTTILNGGYTLNNIYVSGDVSSTGTKNFNIRRADDQSNIFSNGFVQSNSYRYNNFSENVEIIFGIYCTNGTVFNNYKFKPQLVVGTEPDYDYESYTGGKASPNPDYPQEIISCGDKTKNLCGELEQGSYNESTGKKNTSSNYRNKEPIKVLPSKNYIFSINGVGQAINVFEYKADGTYIGRIGAGTVSANTYFTTSSETAFINIFRGTSAGIEKWQIEQSDTVTLYEPHGYKIPVNVRSDNLATNFDNGWYNGPNQIFTNANNFKRCIAKIKPNTTYTISKKNASNRFVVITSEFEIAPNVQYKRLVIAEFNTNRKVLSFTTQDDENYLFFGYYSGTDETEIELAEAETMIVEGSTTPDKYIPYYNETTNIYLDEPLRKTKDGTYVDYIDFINQKVVRRIKETLLDDNITWITGRFANEKRIYTSSSNIDSNMRAVTSNSQVGYLLSNQYKTEKLENILALSVRYGIGISSTSYFSILNQDYASATDFLQALHDDPIVLDYVLRTPTEEDIELPNIPTLDGNNTLNIETEITPSQVYIKYKSNS